MSFSLRVRTLGVMPNTLCVLHLNDDPSSFGRVHRAYQLVCGAYDLVLAFRSFLGLDSYGFCLLDLDHKLLMVLAHFWI